jgi:hypothetical protein
VVASLGLARSRTVLGSWIGTVEVVRCGVVARHGAGKFARVRRSGTVRLCGSEQELAPGAGTRTESPAPHGARVRGTGTARRTPHRAIPVPRQSVAPRGGSTSSPTRSSR